MIRTGVLAVTLALMPAVAAAQPELDVRTAERYYDVEADSIGEVVAQLNRMRARGPTGPLSQGVTRFDIRPVYRALAGGGSCRVADLRVEVRIAVTLPRWPGHVDRPEEEQARWQVIEEAVREHEYGHRDLTIDVARELAASLRGREARGCRALRQVVQGELSIHGARLREEHAEHDRTERRILTIG